MKLLLGLMFIIPAIFRSSVTVHHSPVIEQDTTYIPENVTLTSFNVITIADTAYKSEEIGQLMSKAYGELFTYIARNNLRSGKVMAFYYTSTLPFAFDAAVEVDSLPAERSGRIRGRTITGGNAIVVHYHGPYDQIGAAYASITKWLKENNRKPVEAPFEVYINDPATVKDPKQLRTDVYQRIE